MRPPISRLAAITAAAALASAAPAAAAPPDKQATLDTANPSYTWTSGPASGVVVTSTVAKKVGCNAVLFSCDFVLLKTTQLGTLRLATTSSDQTLKDIDLHLYTSDANGTQGDLWEESTGETTEEALVEPNLPIGYWLVKVDYYLGAGSYTGTASFTSP